MALQPIYGYNWGISAQSFLLCLLDFQAVHAFNKAFGKSSRSDVRFVSVSPARGICMLSTDLDGVDNMVAN